MVLSELWNDILLGKLTTKGDLAVKVAKNQLNYAIGYKGKNRDFLKKEGYNIKFTSSSTLKNFEIDVCHN